MKKAIFLIPACLLIGGFFYQVVQTRRVAAGLAKCYPAFGVHGKIKKGRTRYAQVGR